MRKISNFWHSHFTALRGPQAPPGHPRDLQGNLRELRESEVLSRTRGLGGCHLGPLETLAELGSQEVPEYSWLLSKGLGCGAFFVTDSVQSIDRLWKQSQSSPRKMSVELRLVTANSIHSAWSLTIIQTSVNPLIDPSAFRVPLALYTGILIGRVQTVRWFFFTNSQLMHDPVAPLSRRAFALS